MPKPAESLKTNAWPRGSRRGGRGRSAAHREDRLDARGGRRSRAGPALHRAAQRKRGTERSGTDPRRDPSPRGASRDGPAGACGGHPRVARNRNSVRSSIPRSRRRAGGAPCAAFGAAMAQAALRHRRARTEGRLTRWRPLPTVRCAGCGLRRACWTHRTQRAVARATPSAPASGPRRLLRRAWSCPARSPPVGSPSWPSEACA